jgi:hypothetical protein
MKKIWENGGFKTLASFSSGDIWKSHEEACGSRFEIGSYERKNICQSLNIKD